MSDVIDAIAGGRGVVVPGLKIVFPSTTVRISKHPYSSASGGYYDPKVISFGTVSNQASDRSGRLPAVDVRVLVSDTDRTFQRLYSKGDYRGSAATIYLMTPTVAAADWFVRFSGILTKISFPSPFVAELTLRTNDEQLARKSPRGGWALTRQVFPNAKAEIYDQFAPILYGIFDSSTMQTAPGLIPALLVDIAAFRYLVCAGIAKEITRVFADGVQQTITTDYTVENITRNGRSYTCLKFVDDQGDAEITCDARGYEDVGDGSGGVITNPATQMAHWISNFVLGDYKTGAWLSTNSLFYIGSFTDEGSLEYLEAKLGGLPSLPGLTHLGASGSIYSASQLTGTEIIAKFCTSYLCRVAWSMDGQLIWKWEGDARGGDYSTTVWKWNRDEMGPLVLTEDDYKVTSSIVARSAYSPSQSAFLQTLEVMDASVSTETPDSMDMGWGSAA